MRPLDPRLLREAPAARRFLLVATLLAAVAAAATIAQAAALGLLIARIFLHHAPLSAVRPELVTFATATVARSVVAWLLESGGRLAALETGTQLRAKVIAHLLEARPAGVRDLPAGELAAVAVTGLDALEPYFARFLPQLVLSALVPPAILMWVAWHDLTSALVMAVTLPLIPVFGILIGRVTEARSLRRFATLSVLSASFLDVVRGLSTLRAFGRGASQAERIGSVSDAYRRETMGTLRIGFLSALVLELAATLSTAVIAVEIGVRLVDGGIALAPAFAILVLAPEYYGPLRAAAAQFHASADGFAAAQRAFALLDLAAEVARPRDPLPVPGLGRVAIIFEGVTLRYPGRDAPALDAFDATLPAGERIAVRGESGAGKSSLLTLLLRLVDPSEGRIVAGGIDAARVEPDAWRAQFAWLPQRPRLSVGTIRDALADGRALTDDDLWRALEQASAAAMVMARRGRLDAVLDERTPLSAGEIRRLALARALAARRPVLVLDEPTTHLDDASAAAVVCAIAALPRDATVVFATHDARLLEIADRVLDVGRSAHVVESVA